MVYILLLSVFAVGCKNECVETIDYKRGDKEIYTYDDCKNKSTYLKEYYSQDTIIYKRQFFNDSISKLTVFYKTGKIKKTGHEKNRIENGEWIYYEENGNKRISNYLPILKVDTFSYTDTITGEFVEQIIHRGTLNGLSKTYSNEGKLLKEEVYKNDTLISFETYD